MKLFLGTGGDLPGLGCIRKLKLHTEDQMDALLTATKL